MARARHIDDTGSEVEEPQPNEDRDQWGRTPSDPWFGIAPGTPTGRIPLAPGVSDEEYRQSLPPPPAPRQGGRSFFDDFDVTYDFNVQPFGETYTAGQFAPPTFTEQYTAPTIEEMLADPGYQARLNAGLQAKDRAAAAQGSVLSGGHLKALGRYGQEYATNEYGNLNTRKLAEYQQRYGQFANQAAMQAQAFGLNETARLNQFTQRYKTYQDAVLNRQQSEEAKFRRQLDLARLGLDSEIAGR